MGILDLNNVKQHNLAAANEKAASEQVIDYIKTCNQELKAFGKEALQEFAQAIAVIKPTPAKVSVITGVGMKFKIKSQTVTVYPFATLNIDDNYSYQFNDMQNKLVMHKKHTVVNPWTHDGASAYADETGKFYLPTARANNDRYWIEASLDQAVDFLFFAINRINPYLSTSAKYGMAEVDKRVAAKKDEVKRYLEKMLMK